MKMCQPDIRPNIIHNLSHRYLVYLLVDCDPLGRLAPPPYLPPPSAVSCSSEGLQCFCGSTSSGVGTAAKPQTDHLAGFGAVFFYPMSYLQVKLSNVSTSIQKT